MAKSSASSFTVSSAEINKKQDEPPRVSDKFIICLFLGAIFSLLTLNNWALMCSLLDDNPVESNAAYSFEGLGFAAAFAFCSLVTLFGVCFVIVLVVHCLVGCSRCIRCALFFYNHVDDFETTAKENRAAGGIV